MPDEQEDPADYSGNSHELMINENLFHLENETQLL